MKRPVKDLQLFKNIVQKVFSDQDLSAVIEELDLILSRNQNPGPDNDGSFSQKAWISCREILSGLQKIELNVHALRNCEDHSQT